MAPRWSFCYGGVAARRDRAGIDRNVMLRADAENVREVVMFPINQRAEDLMMAAPSEVANEQCGSWGFG